MSADDFDVIVFKILEYLYACLKEGVSPNIDKARDVAGCNKVYFAAVISSMLDDGYVGGVAIKAWGGDVVNIDKVNITQAGAQYLSESGKMAKVRDFLGEAWKPALATAIQATLALAIK
ncbi:MAG: YjcQ family protein [Coriobacteriia bacterium]|nr:YjcQ family protein [Coriobacteriia bacterium]